MSCSTVRLLLALMPALVMCQEALEADCQRKLGASAEDLQITRELRLPESRLQMCLYDCILQGVGFSDGRQFNRDGYLSFSLVNVDRKRQPMVREMGEKCDGISNEHDCCQLAADIVACLREGMLQYAV
ncbi:uncharacterized protein LOC120429303 [Culex pipiens pallens]|uniref:uncharacterized protein LOC120429303 n=1 Tax=Culex pipiens pallens TaxID=42434 RepID=UPI001953B375|nr:uncharacterized protein LOC120429303 [Culex pipiens pallens]